MKIIMNECYDPEFDDVSTGTVFLYHSHVYMKTDSDSHRIVDLATGGTDYIESFERVKVLDCELKINTKIEA